MRKCTLCFDIDGVICTNTINNDYKLSKPIKKNIKLINKLYQKKYIIKLYTARCMGRTFDNRSKAERMIKNLTKRQLREWNVRFDKLFFGKPSFDILIDDKSLCYKKNWHVNLLKKINYV